MKYRHLPRLTSRMLVELLKEHTESGRSPGRVAMANIGTQLRAEHAARVWQAMQAVIGMIGAWNGAKIAANLHQPITDAYAITDASGWTSRK